MLLRELPKLCGWRPWRLILLYTDKHALRLLCISTGVSMAWLIFASIQPHAHLQQSEKNFQANIFLQCRTCTSSIISQHRQPAFRSATGNNFCLCRSLPLFLNERNCLCQCVSSCGARNITLWAITPPLSSFSKWPAALFLLYETKQLPAETAANYGVALTAAAGLDLASAKPCALPLSAVPGVTILRKYGYVWWCNAHK